MERLTGLAALMGALLMSAGSVLACDKDAKAKSGCGKAEVAAVADKQTESAEKPHCGLSALAAKLVGDKAKGDCHKGLAREAGAGCHGAGVPTITYRVGENKTECIKEAQRLAGDEGHIVYLVGDQSFESRPDAIKAVTAAMKKRTDEMLNIRMMVGDESVGCPMAAQQMAKDSGQPIKYAALARLFDDKSEAEGAVAQAREKIEKVAMTYKVDGEPTRCSMTASKCAKDGKKKVEYVIGDESTCCPEEAEMLLTRAKLVALIEAARHPEEKQTASL